MDPKFIHEHVLLGIAEAVKSRSPDLQPIIERIRNEGTLYPSALGPHQASYGMVAARVPNENAARIGDALAGIVKNEGPDTTFEGWQVNFLLLCWRRFTDTYSSN